MSRLAILVGMAVVSACGGSPVAGGPASFEPGAWNAADPATRGRMCADLLTKHQLVGMPLDDVVALLGEPDSDNHCISYWLEPRSTKPDYSGRFAVYFRHDRALYFWRDGLPDERPSAAPFDRVRFLEGRGTDRFAMLDATMAREEEFVGHPLTDVVDEFGAPDWVWHDAYYELSPVDSNPGGFNWFRQRQLSLAVDERGVVTDAVDHVVTD